MASSEHFCAHRGRLKLVVTDTRDWRQTYLDCWTTRDELIDACMATAHVPFFLDFRLSAAYRHALSALCAYMTAVECPGGRCRGAQEAGWLRGSAGRACCWSMAGMPQALLGLGQLLHLTEHGILGSDAAGCHGRGRQYVDGSLQV